MAMMDLAATSRTISQQIVCYASVGVRSYHSTPFAVQRSVGKVSLLETTGVCAANGAMNGGHGERNETALHLLTNPAAACSITMVELEFGDTLIELLPWPACNYRQSKTCGPCLHNDWPAATPDQFCNMWKQHRLLYAKDASKASLILCRGVWQRL
ncbi:hypothetical protein TNCV_4094181 [Trichonephila clavipes]|nr:hypothetical protein TNCV_4094181 [Trichonephila clavipes]